MTSAAGRATGGASGARPGGRVGRVEVRRLGRELRGARVDHRVARPEAERQPRGPDRAGVSAGQLGQLPVAEARALDGGEQDRRRGIGRIREPGDPHPRPRPRARCCAPSRRGTRRDPGRAADDRLGHAAAQQAEDPPQPQSDGARNCLRTIGAAVRWACRVDSQRAARVVDPADRLVGVGVAAVRRPPGSRAPAASRRPRPAARRPPARARAAPC